jgi:hypothetical protein
MRIVHAAAAGSAEGDAPIYQEKGLIHDPESR